MWLFVADMFHLAAQCLLVFLLWLVFPTMNMYKSRMIHCVAFHYVLPCRDLQSWNSISIMRSLALTNLNTHTWTVSFLRPCKLLGRCSVLKCVTNYQTQESRWPSCESIVLIVGANLQATALPVAYGVIRTSTVVVTYLVTNSVWHEARWEMGRRKESVDRPLKCVPEPIHLTAREEEDRQKECDDTVWRMYVQWITGRREKEPGTQQQIGQCYIGQYAYIGQ